MSPTSFARSLPLLAALALLIAGVGAPRPLAAQTDLAADEGSARALADYRWHLERMTRDGSWWWASNAEYRAADGPGAPEAYGVRVWADPGGLSGGGCLWSLTEGSPPVVAWTFHEGWDPVAGRPFFYQSHASGAGAGMGHRLAPLGDTLVMEQDFRWSDGSTQRVRHEETWPDDDTHVGASLTWSDGAWVPNRSYRWERRTGGDVPCGPGAISDG